MRRSGGWRCATSACSGCCWRALLPPQLVGPSVLPPSLFSAHALMVGSVVEALILAIALSIGLSDDIAVELTDRDRSPRDAATGFHGPALLPRLVHALLLRHRRAGGQAAVIAVEIANAQDVTLHHGKEAFDAMVQVARRLIAEHARESDVALRLGRTRFALLPDHVTARGHGLLQSLNATLDQIRPGSGLVLRELEPPRV